MLRQKHLAPRVRFVACCIVKVQRLARNEALSEPVCHLPLLGKDDASFPLTCSRISALTLVFALRAVEEWRKAGLHCLRCAMCVLASRQRVMLQISPLL